MSSSLNRLNIYLIKIDSVFSNQICEQYNLSASSQAKLLKRFSALAKRQFIVSRALVSYILDSEYGLSGSSHTVDDSITPPEILSSCELSLCISHSGVYVAAVVSGHFISIDIEQVKRDRDYIEIARKSFHPNEVKVLESSNSKEYLEKNFYKSWTFRECCYKLKMLGNLGDNDFDTEVELKERGFTPFSYFKDSVYLSAIFKIPSEINLIRVD